MRTLFHLALTGGTATIVAGGLLVAGSLSAVPGLDVGDAGRVVGTILLQIGIVAELIAVACHERLHLRELHRFGTTTLQVTLMPGGH
jgi:hypothetical protein